VNFSFPSPVSAAFRMVVFVQFHSESGLDVCNRSLDQDAPFCCARIDDFQLFVFGPGNNLLYIFGICTVGLGKFLLAQISSVVGGFETGLVERLACPQRSWILSCVNAYLNALLWVGFSNPFGIGYGCAITSGNRYQL